MKFSCLVLFASAVYSEQATDCFVKCTQSCSDTSRRRLVDFDFGAEFENTQQMLADVGAEVLDAKDRIANSTTTVVNQFLVSINTLEEKMSARLDNLSQATTERVEEFKEGVYLYIDAFVVGSITTLASVILGFFFILGLKYVCCGQRTPADPKINPKTKQKNGN